ncbi:MAG: hypothetical protein ABI193_15095 [Minicystis sp.]
MPKVTFVNEHRTVEIQSGRKVSDVAAELGIAVCREHFVGTGFGDYTIWVKGADGCVSPLGFLERLSGARGGRLQANHVRILGDVEITTQPGITDRLRSPRPISPPPTPKTDASAPRLGVSAAGTAAFPYGHPQAVGKGEREAIARNTGKPKKAGAAAAAEAEEEESDESESE